ncbi:hypothetical protein MBCUT_08570 [Methanobrevibacter cuticularis]|uniref:UPF0284 protein MBCUT_08570 n=1 Tax=Methanobrevibacter cuticularis TaxID=47311 RepID=A0A166E7P0_9EURY|nr:TIGR00303 family protein [Methanobrevibacter cuticularis]KZX16365.1 hypothetical protein MBCUT_08570 [Methanobrevibacter cuticularis]
MFNGLKTYGSTDLLSKLKGKKPFFVCIIATTATANIPGITGAGATPELMEYTPAGDVELIIRGELRCCNIPPQTIIDGASAPTPAMLTKAALELTNVPYLIADAGSRIKPDVPYLLINNDHGEDIRTGTAVKDPKKIFEDSKLIAKELSKSVEYLVIGESIPAGTTTALGVLTALGYDANFKVSGSTPINPHELKKDVVMEGIANAKIDIGNVNPFDAVKAVGDPMIPAVAGMVFGSDIPVLLAGGTQMAAICSFIKAIDPEFDFSNILIGTTSFVAKDENSDLLNIISQIGDISVNVVDPYFEKSDNDGLKNYLKGFVKEGAGAGGSILMALLLGYSIEDIRKKIEEVCK